uniref:TrmH family RNA methyltransferase n=1 Tax=candidate division WWE3 bacterium TaxID=2053526 RepID=A0A7C4XTQ8_UNCKA
MKKIYVALDNVRSLENVGAIMRTCSFFGIKNLVLIGYSGTRVNFKGGRVLHESIKKTALGAEKDLNIKIFEGSDEFFEFVSKMDLELISVEQDSKCIKLHKFSLEISAPYNGKPQPKRDTIFVFGNELEGVSKEIINKSSKVLEIQRMGNKSSLNVATAVGIVLYAITV